MTSSVCLLSSSSHWILALFLVHVISKRVHTRVYRLSLWRYGSYMNPVTLHWSDHTPLRSEAWQDTSSRWISFAKVRSHFDHESLILSSYCVSVHETCPRSSQNPPPLTFFHWGPSNKSRHVRVRSTSHSNKVYDESCSRLPNYPEHSTDYLVRRRSVDPRRSLVLLFLRQSDIYCSSLIRQSGMRVTQSLVQTSYPAVDPKLTMMTRFPYTFSLNLHRQ